MLSNNRYSDDRNTVKYAFEKVNIFFKAEQDMKMKVLVEAHNQQIPRKVHGSTIT